MKNEPEPDKSTTALAWIESKLEALNVGRSEVRWSKQQGGAKTLTVNHGGIQKTLTFNSDEIARIADDQPGSRAIAATKLRLLLGRT